MPHGHKAKGRDEMAQKKIKWHNNIAELHIQGVSKKPQDKEMERVSDILFILISFQEKYLCSLKIEVSPVVLHIITLHSSNY